MSYVWMTVFGFGFIFLMTTLGAALVYVVKDGLSPRVNALFLGFASGVMLAASVWSLLLPALEQLEGVKWAKFAFFPISLWFIVGGVLFLFLDKITAKKRKNEGKGFSKSLKLFLAVTLHNVPEGLAVGFAFGAAWHLGGIGAFATALTFALGIGIQNFPEGAAIALPMRGELQNKNKAFLFGMGSGIVEPIFALIGFFLSAHLQTFQPYLLALAAGAMVFVVAEDIIPEGTKQDTSTLCAVGVMVGFAVMMALDVALG
ncbi:MAG: ZIP family metal transporter [Clostridia bacterium]|nr:ZIP family metal transporter [Clostridia bacterium]